MPSPHFLVKWSKRYSDRDFTDQIRNETLHLIAVLGPQDISITYFGICTKLYPYYVNPAHPSGRLAFRGPPHLRGAFTKCDIHLTK